LESEAKGDVEIQKKAVEWYAKASRHGHPQAKEALARCYNFQIGVEKNDYPKAKKLLLQARQRLINQANRGDLEAMRYLIFCYLLGKPVAGENLASWTENRLYWTLRAAEAGDAQAQIEVWVNQVDWIFEKRKPDIRLVKGWLRTLARRGSTVAQFWLDHPFTSSKTQTKLSKELFSKLNKEGFFKWE